jgi:hypothetical protein
MNYNRFFLVMFVAILVFFLISPPDMDPVDNPSEIAITKTNLSSLQRVDDSRSNQLIIHQGDEYNIVFRTGKDLVPYVKVYEDTDKFTIIFEIDRADLYSDTFQAEFTLPDLKGLTLETEVPTTVSGFSSPRPFEVEMLSNSTLQGDIQTSSLQLKLHGNNVVYLSGSADDLKVIAPNGAMVDLADLSAGDASVDVGGGGQVTVNLSGRLDLTASGGSQLISFGDPTLGDLFMDETSSYEFK